MQTVQQDAKHRGISRLREIAAFVVILVSIPLLASCGGGGEQGNGSGGGGGDQENGGGKAVEGADGGKGGGTERSGGKTGASNAPPITDLRAIISAPNKKSLNGNRARLKGMEVRSVVSERAFLVGENDAEQLLVLNIGDAVETAEGQQVLVAGRLNVPNPNLEEKLSLTPEETSAMEEQGIFLRAPRVVPAEG